MRMCVQTQTKASAIYRKENYHICFVFTKQTYIKGSIASADCDLTPVMANIFSYRVVATTLMLKHRNSEMYQTKDYRGMSIKQPQKKCLQQQGKDLSLVSRLSQYTPVLFTKTSP